MCADLSASPPAPPSAPLRLPRPASAYTYGPGSARNPELEVLLTDGLGGFAQSSLAGVPTWRSSGLVSTQPSSAQPSSARPHSHLISPLEELEASGEHVSLHSLEIAPNVFEGRGLDLLTGATVWDLLPEREQLWRGVRVRRRSVMPQESGAVVYLYEVVARQSVTLTLGGFFTDRNPHALHSQAPELVFQTGDRWVRVQGERDTAVRLHLPRLGSGAASAALVPAPFAQRVYYRMDAARGEQDTEYVRGCALWRVTFPPGGGQAALSVQGVTPGGRPVEDPWQEYAAEAGRRVHLARRAFQATGLTDEVVATLAVAADAYLVRRGPPAGAEDSGTGICAGYPWSGERSRDAMIALTGLTLVTGRAEVARELIRTALQAIRRGRLPRVFNAGDPDSSDYSVDAALWLAVCVERYLRTTGDGPFARECLPALREMLGWYMSGTEFGIQADPADGLLTVGQAGLTWMDARIHDWAVTPRDGKPVEIQALWLAALGTEVRLAAALGEPPQFAQTFEQARKGFEALWQRGSSRSSEPPSTRSPSLAELLGLDLSGLGGLGALAPQDATRQSSATANAATPADPVLADADAADTASADAAALADGLTPQGHPDLTVRPNAALALALADTPVTEKQLDLVLAQTEAQLLTPLGLRSLSPLDARYQGYYGGPRLVRDAAYHQGTVWPWTTGALCELLLSRGEVQRARAVLAGLTGHLWEAGIGHVSEVFSAEDQRPAGCPFQAWSVAEVLRAHVLVSLSEHQLTQAAQQGRAQKDRSAPN